MIRMSPVTVKVRNYYRQCGASYRVVWDVEIHQLRGGACHVVDVASYSTRDSARAHAKRLRAALR
jgi:hypothetical protein